MPDGAFCRLSLFLDQILTSSRASFSFPCNFSMASSLKPRSVSDDLDLGITPSVEWAHPITH